MIGVKVVVERENSRKRLNDIFCCDCIVSIDVHLLTING